MENINVAVNKIELLPVFDLVFSPVKMYEPINFKYNSNLFANCVGYLGCDMDLDEIIKMMHNIEAEMGRSKEYRKEHPDKIIIDIDIVIFNDCVIRAKDYEQTYFKDGFNHIKNKM